MVNADQHVRSALNRIGYAEKLLNEDEDYDRSWGLLSEALEDARRRNVVSGGLLWLCAVCCDFRRAFDLALSFINEALKQDNLSVRYWRSYSAIVERVHESLADESVPWSSPDKAALFELLVGAGEVNENDHVAYAKHLHAIGNHYEALRILDAVTMLFPHRADALVLAASVARALGAPERVERLTPEPVAFDRMPDDLPLMLPVAQA